MNQVEILAGYCKFTPRVIIEVGACDCSDTLQFHKLYPDAQIYTFECNPITLPLCHKKIAEIDNIRLIEKAVSNISGPTKFYPINASKSITTWGDGNPGASSLFLSSGKYPTETYVQDEITVEATTLKDFIEAEQISQVDILWMDIQGAELLALEGTGEYIDWVKLLHTEVEFQEIYSGQPLYWEVDQYLVQHGFERIAWAYKDNWFGNAIYGKVEHD